MSYEFSHHTDDGLAVYVDAPETIHAIPAPAPLVVEDTAGRLFRVTDTGDANLAHVWNGVAVRRTGNGYVPRANAREQLVRRAGCRIVAEAV